MEFRDSFSRLKKKVKHRLTGGKRKSKETGANIGGSGNDQERRGADIDGEEVEQTHSHLHSVDDEVTEESGLAEGKDIDGEKVEQLDHPNTATSIPHDGKPDST